MFYEVCKHKFFLFPCYYALASCAAWPHLKFSTDLLGSPGTARTYGLPEIPNTTQAGSLTAGLASTKRRFHAERWNVLDSRSREEHCADHGRCWGRCDQRIDSVLCHAIGTHSQRLETRCHHVWGSRHGGQFHEGRFPFVHSPRGPPSSRV